MIIIVRPPISVYIFMGSLKINTTISRIYVVWKMVVLVIIFNLNKYLQSNYRVTNYAKRDLFIVD